MRQHDDPGRRSVRPQFDAVKRLLVATSAMFLIASAGTAIAATPADGFPFRRVTLGATSGCWPIATTAAEQDQGLMGVRQPTRPMLFLFPQAGGYTFWMENTPAPLTGVWIGRERTAIGRWHGIPNTNTLHAPPAPVTAVVEYPVDWPLPAEGALLRVGRRCSAPGGL